MTYHAQGKQDMRTEFMLKYKRETVFVDISFAGRIVLKWIIGK
jgi:hypothetical protein